MVATFLLLFVFFILLDYVWIGLLMKGFYVSALSEIGRVSDGAFKPHIPSMIAVYVALALLVTLFLMPLFQTEGVTVKTVGYAFLFGVLSYGFYEFTNYALLKDWPAKIITADIIWGGVLVLLGTLVTYYIQKLT